MVVNIFLKSFITKSLIISLDLLIKSIKRYDHGTCYNVSAVIGVVGVGVLLEDGTIKKTAKDESLNSLLLTFVRLL